MAAQVTRRCCARGGLLLWEWGTSCCRDIVGALGGRKSILFPSLPEGYVSEWRTCSWLYLMRGLQWGGERNEMVSRDALFGFAGSRCSEYSFWMAETEGVRNSSRWYTFVIFVTEEGSCGYSDTPWIIMDFLVAFLSLVNRAQGKEMTLAYAETENVPQRCFW